MIRFLGEFGSRRRVHDRTRMSAAVRKAVRNEERNGAIFSNAFRYVFFLFVSVPVVWNALNAPEKVALYINLGTIAAYLFVTVAHSLVLARAAERPRRAFDYLVLVFDFALILISDLTYNFVLSPNNFAFALKNSTLLYMFLPLALTVLQFRYKLVLTALGMHLVISAALVGYALYSGVVWTNDWNDYINGPRVVFSDMMTRPIVYLCVSVALLYAIHRSLLMVQRIGLAEGKNLLLAQYFPPQIMEVITEDMVAGRRQNVTILFCDVRDFTELSETLDPDEMVATLGELRRLQTRVIFEYGGTLDKFIGDAVMATFGTPRVSPEAGRDSKNAVLCGRAMLRSVRDWNRGRQAAGKPPLPIGIGLHAGDVFVGNVGLEGRLEYTVIGDAVNTAARIEGLCKQFDWPFIMSRAVRDAAGEAVPSAPLPDVRVKGKAEPLRVFRVLWEE